MKYFIVLLLLASSAMAYTGGVGLSDTSVINEERQQRDTWHGQQFTASNDGCIDSIFVYCRVVNSTPWKLGIYRAYGDSSMVDTSASRSLTNTSREWAGFEAVLGGQLKADSSYFIVAWSDGASADSPLTAVWVDFGSATGLYVSQSPVYYGVWPTTPSATWGGLAFREGKLHVTYYDCAVSNEPDFIHTPDGVGYLTSPNGQSMRHRP